MKNSSGANQEGNTKNHIQKAPLQLALLVSLALLPVGRATAQTFTSLYNFTAASFQTNSDGYYPASGLFLLGDRLFGSAYYGGTLGNGTVSSGSGTLFAVDTDGTHFSNLHNFTIRTGQSYVNGDGAQPGDDVLIQSGGTLYGTAQYGGTSGNGALFSLNVDGTSFANLHNFSRVSGALATNSDGTNPSGGLILSGDTLFGMTIAGGLSGSGIVYSVRTNGTGFTRLHSFSAASGPLAANGDGVTPDGLVLSGTTLYGTTVNGGSAGNGTVFKLNTDGTGFVSLYSFSAKSGPLSTNSDGINPSGVVLAGNTLYSVANGGGHFGVGAIFRLNTDGTGFTNLHHFAATQNDSQGYATNSDGSFPTAGLTLSGNTLFGTAFAGGHSHQGTVFAINISGAGFTTLHHFTPTYADVGTNSDGAGPDGVLTVAGNTLYGTTTGGGNFGNGTIFSFSLPPPPPVISRSAANAVVTWPTNAVGFLFTLQSTTNLVSPAVWNDVSAASAVVSGQNTVTDPITDAQRFYRLSQ